MRLAAQMRGGFYPASPQAVALAASLLRPPAHQPLTILDPCAGEGAAIQQLASVLGCSESMIFAIELDDSRAEKLRTTLPEAHVLAPASFFGCRATMNSFSFIWLNPPFDYNYDGHRMEDRFLLTATDWLMPGGVMALVCPEDVIGEFSDARRHFATYFDRCMIVPFPADHRPFNEVIVFGHKRSRPRVGDQHSLSMGASGTFYHLPASPGPRIFQKVEPTESELQQLLKDSPLRSHLAAPEATPLPTPPLALGIGHVALLLASGHLNGVVQSDGQSPHLVRGTSRKQEFLSEVTEDEDDESRTIKRTVISERIELVVRTVDLTGNIQTFMDGDGPA
jgi:tRNA1(Val) A37 N6-methylase TrmN6